MRKFYCLLVLCAFVIIGAQFAFTKPEPKNAVELGKLLFSDPILSGTRKISCASCHKEEFAFADTSAVSLGVHNRKGIRNTPSSMNLSMQASFFWDGRASTLEKQALIPIANPIEMDLPIAIAVKRLQLNTFYRKAFQNVFHEMPNQNNLASALAEFQRTLETTDSPFDDWRMNDNEDAVSASAKRGFILFNGKGNCVQCHFGPDFNNVEFRTIGLYDGKKLLDSGRAGITKKPADLGKFKIGPLRNIALTAPYMHNGMFKTLREVINYYNDPEKIVPNPVTRDSLLSKPLNLTETEKDDLENFLRTLTDKRFAAKRQ
ncbi:cytochrome-c peroxidase [Pedobacter fastidiosus]|uniref:Cytochrome-c peroxidase n=1 Tax=Pedobacter fastidiosus TaxID=2765361 RepID=A0ABR7KXS4_9SPHI|nr:cytochrome c peroxidase [Pedobacter fastidiosus]MBC6112610.1 cytochrome-c peroxidase [Pedobacter fastidiosus]